MKIASSLRQLWHQLWGIAWRKKLYPDAIPTIFERPEPTGMSSVASEEENHGYGTSITDSQPKRPRKVYEKRERARVTRTKMVNYCKQAGNDGARLHHSGCPHQTPLQRQCCRKTKMMNTKGLIH